MKAKAAKDFVLEKNSQILSEITALEYRCRTVVPTVKLMKVLQSQVLKEIFGLSVSRRVQRVGYQKKQNKTKPDPTLSY